MDTEQVIRNAEAQIALAKLAAALRTATSCTLRRPADSLGGSREVVLAAPEHVAQALFEAVQNAAKHV